MAVLKTGLASDFENHKRLDITTHRGPLLTSTAKITFAAAPANNDVIFLAPIAYTACVKEMILEFTSDITVAMTANIGIYGILPNGTTQLIKNNALGKLDTGKLDAHEDILTIDCEYWDKTIYQLLCDAKTVNGKTVYVPSEEFKPFKDSKYGMLALTVTAPGAGIVAKTTMSARIDYVESTSSSQVIQS